MSDLFPRTYGLTLREARQTISDARLLLIRLSHEQPDYEPQLQGFECALLERVTLIQMTVVNAFVPDAPMSAAEIDRDDARAFEADVMHERESYIDWH